MDKRKEDGYLTVEAALVVPFVMGGIIFTMYLCFYLYHAGILTQISHIAALRGSGLTNASEKEIKAFVEEETKELLKQKVLIRQEIKQDIKISLSRIQVNLAMEMAMPIMEEIPLVKRLWTIKREAEATRINPVKIIRGVRKINENQISE